MITINSDKIVSYQTRYLRGEEKLDMIEKRFCKISGKYVLYRRKNAEVDGIQYVNVEEFLSSL